MSVWAGPYQSNWSDQNSVEMLSEIIIILLAFLESKWKKPGKTTSWTPTKMKKMQKTKWSTGEEATDAQQRTWAARLMLQGGVGRPTIEWRLQVAHTPASQVRRYNRAELRNDTYRQPYIHPERANKKAVYLECDTRRWPRPGVGRESATQTPRANGERTKRAGKRQGGTG